jgi:competence protein ComEC
MPLVKGRIYLFAIFSITGIISAFYPLFLISCGLFLLFLYKKEQKNLLFYFLLCTAFFFIYTAIIVTGHHTTIAKETSILSGKIATIPVIEGDRLSFEFTTNRNESVVVFYRIKTNEQKSELKKLLYGMKCSLSGELKEPGGKRNFSDFNYNQFLHNKNIFWVFTPKEFLIERCVNEDNNFLTRLYRFKQNQITMIQQHFPENIVGMVIALVFGDKNDVPDQLIKMYQQQGLIHLLAISGLHVSLIIGILFYLFIRIGLTRERAATILIVFFIPIYILLTGASPSIIRAGLMTILILGSYRLKLRIHPLDIISSACVIQLLLDPYIIYNIGFQFSYLISFTLIVSSKKILNSLHRPLHLTLIITSISQLISLPLVLWNNYEISLFSIILNILFIPLISFIILPLSLLSVLLLNINIGLAMPFTQVIKVIINIAHELLFFITKLNIGNLIFGKPKILVVLLLYFAIFYLLLAWEQKRSLLKPTLVILVILLFQWIHPYFNSNAKVTFIDVGQGDSILIELPFRKGVYLIDTGGKVEQKLKKWQEGRPEFDPGEDIVVPFLKANGIRQISGLILTHGDIDHTGGAFAVVREIKVNNIISSRTPKTEQHILKLIKESKNKVLSIKYLRRGQSWEIENQYFYVLHPKIGENISYKNENDQSLVILAKLYNIPILLTGDLENRGEAALIKAYPNLRASILKVGHHGSKTSTNSPLLNTVQPKVAIISVGKFNRFGHPHQSVLKRLAETNVKILRTDELGAIKLVIDKKGRVSVLYGAE